MKIDLNMVLLVHQLTIKESGGEDGVLRLEMLDSVVSGIYQTFDNVELYPTKEDKASYLAYGVIKNHPFVDGNKRTGVGLMLGFLRANGIKIIATDDELVDLGVGIASSKYSIQDIKDWIFLHKK